VKRSNGAIPKARLQGLDSNQKLSSLFSPILSTAILYQRNEVGDLINSVDV